MNGLTREQAFETTGLRINLTKEETREFDKRMKEIEESNLKS